MIAIGSPTSTVSPSCTRISARMPFAGEGTSESTLSVEISRSVSSSSTSSPTALAHERTVPSITLSPIFGMTTGVRSPPVTVGAASALAWAPAPVASAACSASAAGSMLGAASLASSETGAAASAAAPASAAAASSGPLPASPPPTGAFTSVSITAIFAPTSTVSPSCTRISARRPAEGEGTSESTLSVEISRRVSSSSTSSPTCLVQVSTVPSMTLSPILGMTTSTFAMSAGAA